MLVLEGNTIICSVCGRKEWEWGEEAGKWCRLELNMSGKKEEEAEADIYLCPRCFDHELTELLDMGVCAKRISRVECFVCKKIKEVPNKNRHSTPENWFEFGGRKICTECIWSEGWIKKFDDEAIRFVEERKKELLAKEKK